MVAINLPVIYSQSTKRIGFLFLVISTFFLFLKNAKVVINRDLLLITLLISMFLTALLGIGVNNSSPGVVLFNLSFTFVTTLLAKVNLDNLYFNSVESKFVTFKLSVAIVSIFSTLLFLSVSNYSLAGILALRSNMLVSGVPLNSTINQITILFVALCSCLCLSNCKLEKIFFYAMAVFYGFIILFSLSRQNILFISVFLLFLLTLSFKKRYVFLGFSLFCALFFVIFNTIDKIKFLTPALTPIISRMDRTSQQLGSGNYSRSKQFFDSLNWGLENPVFGLGVGGFKEAAKLHGYPLHNQVPEAAINQLLSEHGAFYTLIFIFLYSVIIINFGRIKVSLRLVKLKNVAIAFLFTFPVLFLFNEIHYQSSLWVIYLIFSKLLINLQQPEATNAIFIQRKISK